MAVVKKRRESSEALYSVRHNELTIIRVEKVKSRNHRLFPYMLVSENQVIGYVHSQEIAEIFMAALWLKRLHRKETNHSIRQLGARMTDAYRVPNYY